MSEVIHGPSLRPLALEITANGQEDLEQLCGATGFHLRDVLAALGSVLAPGSSWTHGELTVSVSESSRAEVLITVSTGDDERVSFDAVRGRGGELVVDLQAC